METNKKGQQARARRRVHGIYLVACISGIQGTLCYHEWLSPQPVLVSEIILLSVHLAD